MWLQSGRDAKPLAALSATVLRSTKLAGSGSEVDGLIAVESTGGWPSVGIFPPFTTLDAVVWMTKQQGGMDIAKSLSEFPSMGAFGRRVASSERWTDQSVQNPHCCVGSKALLVRSCQMVGHVAQHFHFHLAPTSQDLTDLAQGPELLD